MKTKLFMILLGLFYLYSCSNYNHLNYVRTKPSIKVESEIQTGDNGSTKTKNQTIVQHTDLLIDRKEEPLTVQPNPTMKSETTNSDLEVFEKKIKREPAYVIETQQSSNPPCSTIVLTNGTTIEARNVKVTHRDVFFQTCDKDKRLSIPRNEVDRILATNDVDLLEKGVSESRFKDRYMNLFALLAFILGFIVITGTCFLMYFQLWLYAAILALGFLAACLILLFFVNHDLSSLKGVGLLVGATVMSIVNILGQLLLLGEYL